MIHILNYCLLTVVVFPFFCVSFGQAWYHWRWSVESLMQRHLNDVVGVCVFWEIRWRSLCSLVLLIHGWLKLSWSAPWVSRRPTYITHLPANARSCRDLSDDKWTTIEDQTRSHHRCIGLALISFKKKVTLKNQIISLYNKTRCKLSFILSLVL